MWAFHITLSWASFHNGNFYRLPYPQIFGGVSAIKKDHFEKINGFSNLYFGWGGEDDDMYKR